MNSGCGLFLVFATALGALVVALSAITSAAMRSGSWPSFAPSSTCCGSDSQHCRPLSGSRRPLTSERELWRSRYRRHPPRKAPPRNRRSFNRPLRHRRQSRRHPASHRRKCRSKSPFHNSWLQQVSSSPPRRRSNRRFRRSSLRLHRLHRHASQSPSTGRVSSA